MQLAVIATQQSHGAIRFILMEFIQLIVFKNLSYRIAQQ